MVAELKRSQVEIPVLENGDRLSRSEFERRYEAMPSLKKAELIEGIVYMPAALRFQPHAEPHGRLITWLGIYQAFTRKVRMGDNPTVRLDRNNDPQPDAVLFIDRIFGGQSEIDLDGYITGAPELVLEVAASSASIDLGVKKQVYCRNGVQEYLVWQVFDRTISWFELKDEGYELLPEEAGILKSRVFPGLWLDGAAMIAGEMQQVLAVLNQGLATDEHRSFIE